MRHYLVFGSNDKANWAMLNTVYAGGSQQALNAAREQEDYKHYAAVPERNWTSATPSVEQRKPVVKWAQISADQLTVEDAITEKRAEAIEQAHAALDEEPTRVETPTRSETTKGSGLT